MDENKLLVRAQSGDREAFRSLVEAYSSLAERTACVLLSNRADAEDAAQEAWLDAWKAMPRFQVERPFRPWLLAIVANRCRMKARKHDLIATTFDDEMGDLPTDPGPAERSFQYDAELEEAIDTLDNDQRRVIALRFYADLQLDEIAELTNVPLGTVKSRLHRGLAALRMQLQNAEVPNGAKE